MQDFETKTKAVIEWLGNEYAGIRTGQASPALLDGVKVESYGALVPLNQVGSISSEDARTLRIALWDASQVKTVESAIREADFGVSVATDSSGLRVIFPELTAERREQLLKLAKTKLEDARISVRSVRDEAMKDLEKQEKAGELTEDDRYNEKEKIQKIVDETNKKLEHLYTQKEAEIAK